MASRNEVLTLFGATPEQIAAKQRREQLAMVMNQQDPFARAGSALGFGLARLFGGESADVLRARELQGAKEGIDLTTEEGMRNAAQRLQAAGFEDRALQLLDMADRKATAEQARDISQIKIVDKQITVPVTTLDEYGTARTTAVKINVPHKYNILTEQLTPIFDEQTLQSMAQDQIQTPDATTPATTTQPQARIEDRMATELSSLPVGGSYQLPTTGRWVRKLPSGEFEYLTPDQINQEAGITPDQMRGF